MILCRSSLPRNIAWLFFRRQEMLFYLAILSQVSPSPVYCSVEVGITDGATVREFPEMRRNSFPQVSCFQQSRQNKGVRSTVNGFHLEGTFIA